MAFGTFESYTVKFLTTIASSTLAPTVAEYTAGTALTTITPVDGIGYSPTQNNASQAILGQGFIAESIGTWGLGLTLTLMRDDTTDTAITTFPYKTNGYLVFQPFGVTVIAGTKVDSLKVSTHNPVPLTSAENEFQKWQVMFAVQSPGPKFNIAVLA